MKNSPWAEFNARQRNDNPWSAADEERIKRKHDAEAALYAAQADEVCIDEDEDEEDES